MAEARVADVAALVLLVVGAAFMLLAAVGVARMPDVFMRMQTTSKAATLGVGCMMLAVAVFFSDLAVSTRAVAVILFTFLTAPIGAHMIGRAAYVAKAELWEGTLRDDLDGEYEATEAAGAPGNGGEAVRRRRASRCGNGASATGPAGAPMAPPPAPPLGHNNGGSRTPGGGEL